MKIPLKIFAAVLTYLICALAFFSQRTVPVSKIWDSYNVVYAENSIGEEAVLAVLEENGCRGVFTAGTQQEPNVKTILPVYQKDDSSYLDDRLKYFHDQSGLYMIFYVPSEYERNTVQAVNSMIKNKLNVGMDFKQEYPWIVPLVCSLAFAGIAIMCARPALFVLMGILPLMIAFVLPLHPVTSAMILYFLSLLLFLRPFGRKNDLVQVFTNPFFIVIAITAFAMFFMTSLKAGLMALGALACHGVLVFLFKSLKKDFDGLHSFNYQKILTARSFPLMYRKSLIAFLFSLVPLTAMIVMFAVSSRITPASSQMGIAVPGPVSELKEGDEQFPDSLDYYRWVWNKASLPYRNLYSSASGEVQYGDKITQKRFVQTEEGIKESEETLMVFDESFFSKCNDISASLNYPSIENFMEKLAPGVHVTYCRNISAPFSGSPFSTVILLICLMVPMAATGSYLLFGKKKNENSK